MSDQFTKVTHKSWFSRLGSSVTAIVAGFLLVIVSIAGLAWNENRAVQTARSLSEGAGIVLFLDDQGNARDSDGNVVDSPGMLVHATGELRGDVPTDPQFGSPAVPGNTSRLTRTVEMFQWKEERQRETRKKLGGGTETVTHYTYSQGWSSQAIDSGRFEQPTGHQNPPMPVEGRTLAVDRDLVVGSRILTVPASYVRQIGTTEPLPVSEEQVGAIAKALGTAMPVTRTAGGAYIGNDPALPVIGDVRISYEVALVDRASVVAADLGNAFGPWTSTNGRDIFLIQDGAVPASSMFEEEQQSNATFTWILRLVGFVAMLVGFRAIFGIVGVVGDFIPIVGSLTRFATGLVALILTLILAPLTIGIAWIAVRPLLGATIIVTGAAIASGLWFFGRRKDAAAAA
jgi:hypothetical protein